METPEHLFYCQAASFDSEVQARWADDQIQGAIIASDASLATFRFQLDDSWHVAVLGDVPPPHLEEEVVALLATGVGVSLPPDMVKLLLALLMEGAPERDVEGLQ